MVKLGIATLWRYVGGLLMVTVYTILNLLINAVDWISPQPGAVPCNEVEGLEGRAGFEVMASSVYFYTRAWFAGFLV